MAVGTYVFGEGGLSGFIYDNGSYTDINVPGANGTSANDINNRGDVVGTYYVAAGGSQVAKGFRRSTDGVFHDIVDPSAGAGKGTFVEGINDAGQIVGYYVTAQSKLRAFVYYNGQYSDVLDDHPNVNVTYAYKINNNGEITGISNNHGYVARPNLPSNSLVITQTTDYRSTAFVNVTNILYNTKAPATGLFSASQFGSGISPTATITGDGQANTFQVAVDISSFTAANLTFVSWTASDAVVLYGNGATTPLTLTGSSGSDLIFGGTAADSLYGGAGDDSLYGGAGADLLNGGGGFNYARYDTAAAGVTAVLFKPSVNAGDAAGDSYTNIQGLVGSAYGDNLQGDSNANAILGLGGSDLIFGLDGADTLNGGDGDDNIWGGAGADQITGGAGYDYARYDFASAGVTARLDLPNLNTGEAAGDTYTGIEGLVGTAYADTLVGSDSGNDTLIGLDGANLLFGLAGNDALVGGADTDNLWGGAGADVLIGGGGTDYARYDYASAGVTARLDQPNLNTGEAAGDTYNSIEGLVGSAYGDTLVGDGGANTLFGQGGNDVIYGLGGADTLYGGAGNDTFGFQAADFQSGVYDHIKDFNNASGDRDLIALVGVKPADIRYFDTANGALISTAALNGNGGILVDNHTLAQIGSQIYAA